MQKTSLLVSQCVRVVLVLWSHFALQALVALMVLMFDPTFFQTNWAEMSLLPARAPGCADPCKALNTDYSLSLTPSILQTGQLSLNNLNINYQIAGGLLLLSLNLTPYFTGETAILDYKLYINLQIARDGLSCL
jgi:hypothetical protein